MKYLLFTVFLLLSACNSYEDGTDKKGLPTGVSKFRDGNIMCYIYYNSHMSCVKLEEK